MMRICDYHAQSRQIVGILDYDASNKSGTLFVRAHNTTEIEISLCQPCMSRVLLYLRGEVGLKEGQVNFNGRKVR